MPPVGGRGRRSKTAMDVKIKMPDLSTAEGAEITITHWLVEPGDSVQRGDPLVEVETDKATLEVESIVAGVVKATVAGQLDVVSVGDIIATIEVEGVEPSGPEQPDTVAAPDIPEPREEPMIPKKKGSGMFARKRNAGESEGEALS